MDLSKEIKYFNGVSTNFDKLQKYNNNVSHIKILNY